MTLALCCQMTVYSVQCTVYSVQYTVYSVHFTVYSTARYTSYQGQLLVSLSVSVPGFQQPRILGFQGTITSYCTMNKLKYMCVLEGLSMSLNLG